MKRLLAALTLLAAPLLYGQNVTPKSDRVILKSGGLAIPAGYFVIQEEGADLPAQPILDFIGASVTCADDPANSRTKCTLTGGLTNAVANDKLVGSGNAGAGNPYTEITLGTNLTMAGTTLNAAGGGAPATATYLTTTSEAGLSAETNLGALASGILVGTVAAGTSTISALGAQTCTNQFARSATAVGVWSCASVGTNDLSANAVTNAKAAQMAPQTMKGNAGAATADPADLTADQILQLINARTNSVDVFDDLCSNGSGNGSSFFRAIGTGTGNSSSQLSDSTLEQDRPCIVDLSTGSTATGGVDMAMTSSGEERSWRLGGGQIVARVAVRFPTLSVVSPGDEYKFYAGFMYGNGGGSTNSVRFEYDRLNGGDFWRACERQTPDADNCQTSNLAVAANTWYTLEIVVNTDGTSAAYNVNGTALNVSPLALAAPTANMTPWFGIKKSATTGASSHAYVDYAWYHKTLTNPR